MTMRKVCFQIEGEWLTNFFREQFWEANCGYKKIIQMFRESFTEDIPEDICVQILEGRKKFIGVNRLSLVDDNENIRPLSTYIEEKEKEIAINNIMKDIKSNPAKYIDMFACNTAKCWIEANEYDGHEISWWYNELAYKRSIDKDPLENGCYWIRYSNDTAKLIYDYQQRKCNNNEEFCKIIFKYYEKIINQMREDKTDFNSLNSYLKSIIIRNRKYAYYYKIDWSYLNEKDFKCEEITQSQGIDKEQLEYHKDNPYIDKFLEKNGISLNEKVDTNDKFDTSPSELKANWDGFIDREGRFFPTKPIGCMWFKGTANCHGDWAYQYLEENNIEIKMNEDAKDYLIDNLGWCDISHMTIVDKNVYVNKPKDGFSKKQKETLKKLFQLNNDSLERYYKLIGD